MKIEAGIPVRILLIGAKEFNLTIAISPKGLAFQHLILTRFWFAKGPTSANTLKTDVREWLENRLELFLTYCLPSVLAQSRQDFTWLICFDVAAPQEFVEKMRELVSPYDNIEIVTLKSWGAPTYVSGIDDVTVGTSPLLEDIKKRLSGDADWVLTTRFDTDDGLHRDFVKRLHDAIDEPKEEFLNFPNGILAYNNQSYLYKHLSNAFISLFEPAVKLRTVLGGPHERLSEAGPIRQLSPLPAFVQVVHGTNHSNKPRGFRVPKIVALQGFEAIGKLFEGSLEENYRDILLDNALWGSFWYGRDQLVNQIKNARSALRKLKVAAAR